MGGDQYISTTNELLQTLELSGHLRLIRDFSRLESSLMQCLPLAIRQKASHLLWSRKGINFPWALSRLGKSPLFWIPDLQHIEEPHFFSVEEVNKRNENLHSQIARGKLLIFSSHNAEEIFKQNFQYNNTAILRFAIPRFLDREPQLNLDCEVCAKGNFMYLPNQWWKHKNHLKAIKAFQIYKKSGGKNHLILSGRMEDSRDMDYSRFINNEIEVSPDCIHNLSVLDRNEQLDLLSLCRVVLQPSLYEGWSTSIEETFSFNKPLIASDIPSIREQTRDENQVILFDPNSIESIAKTMIQAEEFDANLEIRGPQNRRWDRYSADFESILKRLT